MMLFRSLLFVTLYQLARCTTLNVTVGGSAGLKYDPEFVNAEPGDTVRFIFQQKNHTVTQSSFKKPCEHIQGGFDSGFIAVNNSTTNDFPIAQLHIADKSPVWVYCRQANHCQQGMVFAINPGNNFTAFKAAAMGNNSTASNPSSAPASSTTASASSVTASPAASSANSANTVTVTATVTTTLIPSATPSSVDHRVVVGGPGQFSFQPSSLKANVGDTVTFEFRQKNHTVTASSFAEPCKSLSGDGAFDSGFMPVADNATSFPTYTIQINSTNAIWTYCRQADHCSQGMVFAVNPPDNGPNAFEAFQTMAKQTHGGNSSGQKNATSPSSRSATTFTTFMTSVVLIVGAAEFNLL